MKKNQKGTDRRPFSRAERGNRSGYGQLEINTIFQPAMVFVNQMV